MGANRLPTKHSDVCDAPVSSNFLKRLWSRYSLSRHRGSLPSRLLVVLFLSAQIIFLAAMKLGPGGSSWKTLSSFEGLVVGRDVSIGHASKFRPQDRQVPLQFPGKSAPVDKESAMLPDDLPLPISTAPSLSADDGKNPAIARSEDHQHAVDASFDGSTNVAMATTSAVVKGEQAVILEKMFGNVANGALGEGEPLTGQEEHDKVEKEAKEVVSFSETHPGRAVKDEQADRGQEKRVSRSHNDASSQELVTEIQNAHGAKAATPSQCKYGYIYVYDLPAEYNRDIIANCTALNAFLDVCNTLMNGGLGSMLKEASPLRQMGSWFVSDQFTTEVLFHNRMLEYPCLADKPEDASGFYVPYYAGLEVGRFLWGGFSAERRDRVGNQLLEWLSKQKAWKRNGGWGHFMMIGRITWDFRRSRDTNWGSGFFYQPLMQNMTRLLIEKNPWDYMEMAVPYPTNFHPQSVTDLLAWQNHIRNVKRGNLFSFAGAPRSMFPNDFRGTLLDQCQQSHSCQSLDCSNQTCDNNLKSLELFLNSTFCLQPRGDSFTRKSTFDCLLAGSIPVFFWHRSAYMQYKWHLPADAQSYSVFISKDDMRNGTNIGEVLSSYPVEKVQAMREAVIEIMPRIVYAVSGSSLKEHKDAFDVAIEGVMKRFHELNLHRVQRG